VQLLTARRRVTYIHICTRSLRLDIVESRLEAPSAAARGHGAQCGTDDAVRLSHSLCPVTVNGPARTVVDSLGGLPHN
jgi:hypothetical protein